MKKNQPSPGKTYVITAKTLEAFASLYDRGKNVRITARGWHKATPKAERVTVELQLSLDQLIDLRDQILRQLDVQNKRLMQMLSDGKREVLVAYSNTNGR